MKNEIGRKITSLTLMTIMVAGGMTFAIPGILPEALASHNANLFVSAENSAFDNYFSGPMVIEVVVNDPDIKTLDDAHGEPDVTVNGAILRMVQTTDGNWYGYFADRNQAQVADATQQSAAAGNQNGTGLNFGLFCDNNDTTVGGASFSDTKGVAFPNTGTLTGGADQGATIEGSTCSTVSNTDNVTTANVIRESKTPVAATGSVTVGQINIDKFQWPFIQLYDFAVGGNVVVQYNKGGGAQSTTLTFDTVDQYAGVELDRTFYPLSSQIHITLTDLQLNIDPTDEDSWTFGGNGTVFYNIFDESGNNAGAFGGTAGSGVFNVNAAQDLAGNRSALLFEVNGIVFITLNQDGVTVAEMNDNDDQIFNSTLTDSVENPITFTELGVNTGVFGNYDESDNSNFDVLGTSSPNDFRGRSALFEYGEIENSIVVGFDFATIDLVEDSVGGEWNSGEGISVILVDGDANKNSRADEDLDLGDPAVELIPTLKLGSPATLSSVTAVVFVNGTTRTDGGGGFTQKIGAPSLANALDADGTGHGLNTTATFVVQNISDRAMLTPVNDTGKTITLGKNSALIIDLGLTGADLRGSINDPRGETAADRFRGLNQLNYDIGALTTNLTGSLGTFEILLLINATGDGSGDIISAAGGISGDLPAISLANSSKTRDLINLNQSAANALCDTTCIAVATGPTPNTSPYNGLFTTLKDTDRVGLAIVFGNTGTITMDTTVKPIVFDFFSTGIIGDGLLTSERINNQIIRIELEETGDNTSTFRGWFEYTMLSQINIFDNSTYNTLFPIDDYAEFLVSEDFTDEDSLRVRYDDLGSDGVVTPVADQQEAPTHSGVVSFDASTYKVADTVIVTLSDADLNKDVDIIDIYTTVDPVKFVGDVVVDRVGKPGLGTYANGDPFGSLLFITFNDALWTQQPADSTCNDLIKQPGATFNQGLFETGFTLIETGTDTGEFVGTFQVPNFFCQDKDDSALSTTTGTDIEVNYLDFRDASGEVIEVGDSAGIRANTGSVSLDRTVYPVPFGAVADFTIVTSPAQTDPAGDSLFPVHATAIGSNAITSSTTLPTGDLQIHIRINDPDFDISAAGEDVIGEDGPIAGHGPLKITISRGADKVIIATAGAKNAGGEKITVLNSTITGVVKIGTGTSDTRELGPITEIAPDAGIFEIDVTLRYTDGPTSSLCPTTDSFVGLNGTSRSTDPRVRFSDTNVRTHCLLQGDIITVEYTDPTDASGNPNTVTDSATFDLRNGVLQSDKSVYIIGGDLIMTLIEPDFDLDNDAAETYDLDLIEWDSDAATITMGDLAGTTDAAAFDPEPSDFRETGDSTGIFQIVIEIPQALKGDNLERGEEIVLEYTDWGPSGADHVGDEDEDINLTIFTSNFGATVELDQKVYTWTDKVYITIVAPDHNFDSDLIDEIGESALDPIKVSTRGNNIDRYKLVETGTDTGIFTGEVILTGFKHDADGDGTDDAPTQTPGTSADKGGPTDGFLETDDDDGITVSFEFSEDETVIGSALIRWNIGETQWLEASYPASGTGVVRIIDPDMNLNPEAVDNFNVDVWSDSDAGGIDLTVTETNEATGIFEGTVFFTTTDESSGHRLRVAEGDTITAEYEDNTLPDPYTTADELDITGTSLIGTIVPPLERAPAANARVVDAFGNALAAVSVDQQVQITADLANGQDRDQLFAYLVQVQDSNGVTISLAWITGSLAPGQSFSPALSWTPDAAGTYTATVFVWESVNNPTALSPPTSVDISVS